MLRNELKSIHGLKIFYDKLANGTRECNHTNV